MYLAVQGSRGIRQDYQKGNPPNIVLTLILISNNDDSESGETPQPLLVGEVKLSSIFPIPLPRKTCKKSCIFT